MTTTSNHNINEPSWFAISTPLLYMGEVKKLLQANDLKLFIPTRNEKLVSNNLEFTKCTPAIPGIIFIRTSKENIRDFINSHVNVKLMVYKDRNHIKPLIISDHEISMAMSVNQLHDNHICYTDTNKADLKSGKAVRITKGIFNGIEGTLTKVSGFSKERVIITLGNLVAIVLPLIKSDDIKEI